MEHDTRQGFAAEAPLNDGRVEALRSTLEANPLMSRRAVVGATAAIGDLTLAASLGVDVVKSLNSAPYISNLCQLIK